MNTPNDQYSQPSGQWHQPGPPQFGNWQPPMGSMPVEGEYLPNEDEKLWAVFTHLGMLVLGFIAPLVIMVTKGEQSTYVKDQSKEALNLVLNLYGWLFAVLAVYITVMVTLGSYFMVLPVLMLLTVIALMYIMPIIAAVKVSGRRWYRYPFIYRIVR